MCRRDSRWILIYLIHQRCVYSMAEFFEYIPIIGIILFAAGIVGAMVYERVRTKNIEESSS